MTVFLLLGVVAFGVSLVTLFSGFGLGTLLMPAFALFFPIDVAVAATAVVHGANNLFKVGLLLRGAVPRVVFRFGIPAVLAAIVGAYVLTLLSEQSPLASWDFLGRSAEVTPVKLVMGVLILLFSLFELVPALRALRAPERWLPFGGILSGFFGGLSGHQGALRAAFLAPLKLSPTEFVATQAVLAVLVDVARLLVYGWVFAVTRGHVDEPIPWGLVVSMTLCAFAGAYLGKRMLRKATVAGVQATVGVLLVIAGVALIAGVA